MNSELLLRLSQIKQYISSLNDSLAVSNHSHAAATVTKFKKAMSKTEEHVHANQFILDCLRTRNEKLRAELFDLEQEKKAVVNKLTAAKNAPREIKQTKAEICITRLTLSLGESKKVDYEEVTLRSDYKNIFVNSVLGQKYKDYAISIEEAQQFEHRANLLYFCAIGEQVFHIIAKFKTEKDAYRWTTCLKHGQLSLKYARKKDRLFEEQKEPVAVAPPVTLAPPPPLLNNTTNFTPPLKGSTVKSTLGLTQVPFLNFNPQVRVSPSESGISDKRFTDKSYQRQADKSGQKNTERSLMNALNFDAVRSSGAFGVKESAPVVNNYERRLDLNRPPHLTKVRNNSNHDYGNVLDTLKVHKSGYRKQSEDIIKPHINQVYHQKMMENYRSQEQQDDSKSQAPIQKIDISPVPAQKTQKLRSLEQRKKQLLKPSQHLSIDKPPFLFDNKVTWMGIQQMEDQNKSKSSNRISHKSRKGSQFSESGVGGSSEHIKRETEDNHSEHITEKSQEESPKLPKHTFEVPVPQKYAYPNGIVFQLHQVEKTQNSSPILPASSQSPERLQRPSSSSSLDSDDDDHSDPSSHQNHTQSQDNNARSQQLKKGIILTKCSQNGFWTHEKILYLSQNNSELCSRDLKDKKIKKIKIGNIKDVEYKKFDKGIIKHISKIEEDKCFVIRALDEDGNIKNYQFVGNIAEPLEHFANNLKLFVQYLKKQ